MARGRFILAAAVVFGAASVSADLPDGERVIDRLSAVFRQMRDLTADVEIHTARRQASGNIVLQYVRRGSKENSREEHITRRYIVVTRIKTEDGLASIKQLNDGEYLWVERRIAATGEVRVIRRKVKPDEPVPGGFGPDWRKEIDLWRGKYVFRTLRADTFDEEPVTVVEGIRKEAEKDADAGAHPGLSLPERVVLYVSTRDDFPRKVELFATKSRDGDAGARETPAVSVRLMHVKLNEGLDPETFVYVVPQGAELILAK